MRKVHFAVPGDLGAPTGGYAYARRLIAALPETGWQAEHVALPEGFPFPGDTALAEAGARLAALPDGANLLVDGLAFGAMPGIARDLGGRLDLVALVHHPLADETGLPPDTAAMFMCSEREALAFVRAVICTSHTTARRLADGLGVTPNRITVAPPGTDRYPKATGVGGAPVILSVGTLAPRKGHDVFLNALALIADLPWTVRIAGAADRDPACAASLHALARDLGLEGRVSFLGAVGDLASEFPRADIFALATRHEGYGMVFAEALAHGLPLVGCRAGAVPEVVPQEAGTLVAPDNPRAFAAALAPLVADSALRRARADAAWAAGQALPRWHDTAVAVARCLAGRAG